MGLCASMLQRKAKKGHPEPRRGTPKALFVIRNERGPSKPQALVVQAQKPGGSGFQKPKPRFPCGSTRSVAVEPVSQGTTTQRSVMEGCRTPMTPRRTPVWQRRILMGTRCELPRFSGLILYDEHGRPLQSGTQNRADHLFLPCMEFHLCMRFPVDYSLDVMVSHVKTWRFTYCHSSSIS